jgi:hypothetical protein
MKMKLSRALRYQKRVKESIKKTETDVQSDNSKPEGEERDTDITLALAQRAAWVNHLTDLKLATQMASADIRRDILELAECKAEISFLQRLDVQKGTVKDCWSRDTPAIKYETVINKNQRDGMVSKLQDKIDAFQTKIDNFNTSTELEVADPELP